MLARHRDPEEAARVARVEIRRQAVALVAEDERVARLERTVVKRARAPCGEEKETARPLGRQIVLPRVVDGLFEVRPIVKPGPRDGLVIHAEPKRAHQVQLHAKPDAQAPDGPCIMRYLRPQQHN